MSALGQKRTHASQQKSGRASPVISFVYLSAECLFNKFYGINCRPKFDTKLLDRFFHLRWQVSPPVNNLRHYFLGRFPACPRLQFHDRFSPCAVACLPRNKTQFLNGSSVPSRSCSLLSVVLVEPSSA